MYNSVVTFSHLNQSYNTTAYTFVWLGKIMPDTLAHVTSTIIHFRHGLQNKIVAIHIRHGLQIKKQQSYLPLYSEEFPIYFAKKAIAWSFQLQEDENKNQTTATT